MEMLLKELFDSGLKNVSKIRTKTKQFARKHGLQFSKLYPLILKELEGDIGKVWNRRRKIKDVLAKYGINDQRSSAWHTKRGEMITASEVTKAFKTSTPAARYEIMMRKLVPQKPMGDSSSKALIWGTQFEPIAKMLYEKFNNVSIVDTSCVRHPKYDFLGASPDGIVLTPDPMDARWGKLVEFKCPISRVFKDDSPVPDYYWHQMQMQMECTGIDTCDYLEFKFNSVPYSKWLQSKAEYKSAFLRFDDSNDIHYKPLEEDYKAWMKRINPSNEEYSLVCWELGHWRTVVVPRDYTWIPTHLEELSDFWNEVLEHKKNGTLPANPIPVEKSLMLDLTDMPETGSPVTQLELLLPGQVPESS